MSIDVSRTDQDQSSVIDKSRIGPHSQPVNCLFGRISATESCDAALLIGGGDPGAQPKPSANSGRHGSDLGATNSRLLT